MEMTNVDANTAEGKFFFTPLCNSTNKSISVTNGFSAYNILKIEFYFIRLLHPISNSISQACLPHGYGYMLYGLLIYFATTVWYMQL